MGARHDGVLIVIAILLIASHCPESWQGQYRIAWWVGVAISVIVVLLSVVTHHGLTVTSGLAGWLWDWSADPGTTLAAGCTPRWTTSADSAGTRSASVSTTADWSR